MSTLKILLKLYLLVFICHNFVYTNCDKTGDLVSKIENEISRSLNYTRRVDNSDIFTAELTKNSTYFDEFDFIVVGGGSAGAVIAKRLSESRFRVLLLEAGVWHYELSEIPRLHPAFQHTDINWGYFSTPQKNVCQGMESGQCAAPRGKILGGTSSINSIVYARGNSQDQDAWRDFGASGWSWNETVPYFKKLEDYRSVFGDNDYHGFNGPVHMDYAKPFHLLDNLFYTANKEVHNLSFDYNGRLQLAAGMILMTKKDGKRESTSRTYLKKYDSRYLKVETNAFVHKILFRNRRAIGVEFIKNNRANFKALANKEVVISGGAFNSPQLLMLSGIGPKEELAKHNIPVLADLPVGKNLKDHVVFFGLNFDSKLPITNKSKTLRDHVLDFQNAVGSLTTGGVNSLCFIATDGNATYPDIEFTLSATGRPLVTFPNTLNLKPETVRTLQPEDVNDLDYAFQISTILLHPKSKGALTLKSKSPNDFPVIDFNSLSEFDDIERLYNALAFIKKLVNSKTFKAIDVKIVKQVLPSCEELPYDSREFWICTIRHLSIPAYHSTSTCIMGQNGSGVVDSELRVHGIRGLRVADLSVAPRGNSGHSNALAMMIGEKAADIIKTDYL